MSKTEEKNDQKPKDCPILSYTVSHPIPKNCEFPAEVLSFSGGLPSSLDDALISTIINTMAVQTNRAADLPTVKINPKGKYLDVFKPTTVTFLDREILEGPAFTDLKWYISSEFFYFKNSAKSVAGLHHTENLHLYND